MTQSFPVQSIRQRFPGLARLDGGREAVFFDGPAGSQTPQSVIDAIAHYLAHTNANVGGTFATGVESDAVLASAHRAMADLFGAGDPDEVVFGPNMTSLTYLLAETLARTWEPGDEVVITRADHDANVSPWVAAAADAGVTVREVAIRADASLDLDSLDAVLGERTRLVAIAAASNLVGTIHPVAEVVRRAHSVGSLVFVDAVHYAPHRAMDVAAWGCDFVCCSAYKFFGPHVGALWGRGELLRELPIRRLRPASSTPPGSWMRGTQNHEGIAGAGAAVEYLADLGAELGATGARRDRIVGAFEAIQVHEEAMAARLLAGLAELPDFTVHGISEVDRVSERTATVSFTHARRSPAELAEALRSAGIYAWPGHSYAVSLSEALGLEPQGALRVGMLHYNTVEEVDRLLECLRSLSGRAG